MNDEMLVDHRDVGAVFRRLSLPYGISMAGDQLLTIVDTIVIGSMGPVALAGATAATTVFVALTFTVIGYMSGCGIICAQRIGAGDMDGFGRTVRAGMLVPLAAAIAVSVLATFGSHWILHAMVGALPSANAGASYLAVRAFSTIPIAFTGIFITALGAAGHQRLAVRVLALINSVHIPLLLVLALGWGTHHPLGIPGAGISSLLSEGIAAIYATWYVWVRPQYRVFSRSTLDLRLAVRSAVLGTPEAVFLFAMMLPDAVIVGLLAPLGALRVAAFRALVIVSDLTFIVPIPLQSAIQTVVGQRIGAGDIDGAIAFFHRARRQAVWITTATALGAAALAWPAAYAFTLNWAVANVAAAPLAAHMATLPIKGWAMTSMAPIRASGDTAFSMLVGILTSVLVIPAAFVFIRVFGFGLWGVPLAWIVAWGARSIVTGMKLRTGSWTRRAAL